MSANLNENYRLYNYQVLANISGNFPENLQPYSRSLPVAFHNSALRANTVDVVIDDLWMSVSWSSRVAGRTVAEQSVLLLCR